MFFSYNGTRVYSIFRIWGTFVGLAVSSWRNPNKAPPRMEAVIWTT